MGAYITRRILYAIPLLIGVNLITFALFFTVNSPDDVARMHLGQKRVNQEQIETWKQERGYDKPLVYNSQAAGIAKLTDTIFFEKSLRLFIFDFGRSDSGRDISWDITQRMGPSLTLAIPSLIVGLLVNITFALLIAFFRGTYIDLWGVILCVALMSISGLFYIVGGQWLISKLWHLVPISGFEGGWDSLKFLVLPVAIGVISGIGSGTRWYRSIFLEEINRDYVRTARAKGLSELRVAVHGQPDHRVLFRYPGARQLHHRCDPEPGFRDRAFDGFSWLGAVHHRSGADRYFLHTGRSQGAFFMIYAELACHR